MEQCFGPLGFWRRGSEQWLCVLLRPDAEGDFRNPTIVRTMIALRWIDPSLPGLLGMQGRVKALTPGTRDLSIVNSINDDSAEGLHKA
jgi:hypothetical protein